MQSDNGSTPTISANQKIRATMSLPLRITWDGEVSERVGSGGRIPGFQDQGRVAGWLRPKERGKKLLLRGSVGGQRWYTSDCPEAKKLILV